MTFALAVLLGGLVVEFGVGLYLAWCVLGALKDRQEVFSKYAKAVGRDSLTTTREAAKAVEQSNALREDARLMHERVDQKLSEFRRD